MAAARPGTCVPGRLVRIIIAFVGDQFINVLVTFRTGPCDAPYQTSLFLFQLTLSFTELSIEDARIRAYKALEEKILHVKKAKNLHGHFCISCTRSFLHFLYTVISAFLVHGHFCISGLYSQTYSIQKSKLENEI